MSFPVVASYSDKGLGPFAQGGCVELNADFFDEFLNYDHECINIPQSTSPEYSASDTQSGKASISTIEEEGTQHLSWHGETWGTNTTNPASLHSAQGNQFYAELSGRAAISDSELLSLERISLESPCIAYPQSSLPASPPPSTATTLRRKNRIAESLSHSYRRGERTAPIGDGSLLRSPIRKSISAPKMLRAPSRNFDARGQLENSTFKFEQDFVPLTPPLSVGMPSVNDSTQFAMPMKQERPLNAFSSNSNYTTHAQIHRSTSYSTPLSTPQLEHHMSRASNSSLQADTAHFPMTPRSQNVSGQWSQVHSHPDFTQAHFPIEAAVSEEPLWWNHAATAPMAQPSPSGFHTSPNHQRISKTTAMQLQNNLAFAQQHGDGLFDPASMAHGLMIHLPQQSSDGLARQTTSQGFIGNQPAYFAPHGHANQPQHHHSMTRKAGRQQLRQPLAPHSPLTSSSSSSQKPAPPASSDSEGSLSPTSPVFQVRKRKGPKKSAGPRAGGAAMGAFVNYTPDDSKKILTGVAPSGSSKTKARREKEALDKRRKLSQAAVRAVRAAGGDVESLEMALIA